MNSASPNTKEVIFDAAVELFALLGYENVSVRDIAEKSGIKASSIYNHFSGKKAILDDIYSYYTEHFFDNHKPLAEVKELLQTGTALEIVSVVMWTFYGFPPKKHRIMTLITRIIYMRFLQDSTANKFFCQMMVTEAAEHMREVLNYLISLGRLNPDFDIETYTEIVLNTRLMVVIKGLVQNYAEGVIDKRDSSKVMLANLLPLTAMPFRLITH